jgi:hypothetical protein
MSPARIEMPDLPWLASDSCRETDQASIADADLAVSLRFD